MSHIEEKTAIIQSYDTHNPVNIDLICEYKQMGGLASTIMENFNTSKIDPTNSLVLMDGKREILYTLLAEDNKKRTNLWRSDHKGFHYNLNQGSFASVYMITKHKSEFKYILKLTEADNDRLITQYDNDKKIFPGIKKNLIDIISYGKITVPTYENNVTRKYYYMIVPVYNTFEEEKIATYTVLKKYNLLRNLAILLDKLQRAGYIIPDLKSDNIGYDDSGEIILIDYDTLTFSSSSEYPHQITYISGNLGNYGNHNYYQFAMLLIMFFLQHLDPMVLFCIFADVNNVPDCKNPVNAEIIEDWMVDIKGPEWHCQILDECLIINSRPDMVYFSIIVNMIDQVIEYLEQKPVAVGGYMMYKTNKNSYNKLLTNRMTISTHGII